MDSEAPCSDDRAVAIELETKHFQLRKACEFVHDRGERIVVVREGRRLAALVSIADLERLERAEEPKRDVPSLAELFLAGGGPRRNTR